MKERSLCQGIRNEACRRPWRSKSQMSILGGSSNSGFSLIFHPLSTLSSTCWHYSCLGLLAIPWTCHAFTLSASAWLPLPPSLWSAWWTLIHSSEPSWAIPPPWCFLLSLSGKVSYFLYTPFTPQLGLESVISGLSPQLGCISRREDLLSYFCVSSAWHMDDYQ